MKPKANIGPVELKEISLAKHNPFDAFLKKPKIDTTDHLVMKQLAGELSPSEVDALLYGGTKTGHLTTSMPNFQQVPKGKSPLSDFVTVVNGAYLPEGGVLIHQGNIEQAVFGSLLDKPVKEVDDKIVMGFDMAKGVQVSKTAITVSNLQTPKELTDDEIHQWLTYTPVLQWGKGTVISVEVTKGELANGALQGSLWNRLVYKLRKAGMPVGVKVSDASLWAVDPYSPVDQNTAATAVFKVEGVQALYGTLTKTLNVASDTYTYTWTQEEIK